MVRSLAELMAELPLPTEDSWYLEVRRMSDGWCVARTNFRTNKEDWNVVDGSLFSALNRALGRLKT